MIQLSFGLLLFSSPARAELGYDEKAPYDVICGKL